MGILSLETSSTGEVAVNPRRVKMVTTDGLSTVIAAGYLNPQNLQGRTIYQTDVLDVRYSFNQATNTGTYGEFLPSISNGVITLVQYVSPADVTLPVVDNRLASFDGTTGKIKDSGVLTSAVQLSANIKAARTADIGGAGAGPISVAVAGLTAASIVTGNIQASTNPVEIQKMTATATGFDVLFSADPGAACTVNYVAFVVAQ